MFKMLDVGGAVRETVAESARVQALVHIQSKVVPQQLMFMVAALMSRLPATLNPSSLWVDGVQSCLDKQEQREGHAQDPGAAAVAVEAAFRSAT
jgi:hypothetical protein